MLIVLVPIENSQFKLDYVSLLLMLLMNKLNKTESGIFRSFHGNFLFQNLLIKFPLVLISIILEVYVKDIKNTHSKHLKSALI